jgi:hypothetical protein
MHAITTINSKLKTSQKAIALRRGFDFGEYPFWYPCIIVRVREVGGEEGLHTLRFADNGATRVQPGISLQVPRKVMMKALVKQFPTVPRATLTAYVDQSDHIIEQKARWANYQMTIDYLLEWAVENEDFDPDIKESEQPIGAVGWYKVTGDDSFGDDSFYKEVYVVSFDVTNKTYLTIDIRSGRKLRAAEDKIALGTRERATTTTTTVTTTTTTMVTTTTAAVPTITTATTINDKQPTTTTTTTTTTTSNSSERGPCDLLQDSSAVDAIVEQLARCGFVQVANYFGLEFMRQLQDGHTWFKAQTDLYQPLRHDFLRAGRTQTFAPFSGVFASDALIRHPVGMRVSTRHFNMDTDTPALLDHVVVINAEPYAAAQELHRDVLCPGSLTVQIPLVEYTDAEMGILQVCERSHATVDLFERELAKAECRKNGPHTPLLSLGSALIYDSSVLHRSKAHNSSKDRPALYVVYKDSQVKMAIDFPRGSAIPATMASFHEDHERKIQTLAL